MVDPPFQFVLPGCAAPLPRAMKNGIMNAKKKKRERERCEAGITLWRSQVFLLCVFILIYDRMFEIITQ